MLWLKLNHVSKRGPWTLANHEISSTEYHQMYIMVDITQLMDRSHIFHKGKKQHVIQYDFHSLY